MRARIMWAVVWLVGLLLVAGPADRVLADYADYVESLSPSVYLRLNETSGPTAFDSSGNGYDSAYLSHAVRNQTGALEPDDPDPAVYANNGDIVGFYAHAGEIFSGGSDPFSISMFLKPIGFAAGK